MSVSLLSDHLSPSSPGDQSSRPRVGKEVSDGAESRSMGQGNKDGGKRKETEKRREMLAAQRKLFVSWTTRESNSLAESGLLFPASVPHQKAGIFLLTQEERMSYKQSHLEPKCLEPLPTQTTQDVVRG